MKKLKEVFPSIVVSKDGEVVKEISAYVYLPVVAVCSTIFGLGVSALAVLLTSKK